MASAKAMARARAMVKARAMVRFKVKAMVKVRAKAMAKVALIIPYGVRPIFGNRNLKLLNTNDGIVGLGISIY